jgi:DNA invertase Pin-like site-specific DNA recombinase
MRTTILQYIRISKISQDFDRQVSDLTLHSQRMGYEIIDTIVERVSGSRLIEEREGLSKVIELAEAKKFQKLIISEISRLGRKTSEVLKVMEKLTELKISIYVHNYGIETLDKDLRPNPVASMIFMVLAETAKLEKETLIQRIYSGLEEAKRKGRVLGRPTGSSKPINDFISENKKIIRLIKEGLSIRQIAKLCEVSPNTVQKTKKLLLIA